MVTRYSLLLFRTIISLLICFLPEILNGQEITVSEDIILKNDYAYDILGKLEGDVLLFRDKVHTFEIHAYDEDLRFKWDREIDFEKRNVDIIGITSEDTVFHVLYGYKSKGDYYIMHRKYDPVINLVDSTTIAIMTRQYYSPRFRFARSEDRTKTIIFRTDNDSEMEVFTYDLVSNTVLWKKLLRFESAPIRRDFRKMIISNNGDMYMLLEHDRTFAKNRSIEILRIDAETEVISNLLIEYEDLQAIDLYATYDNRNGGLMICGLYSDSNISRASGIYTIFLNTFNDRTGIHKIPFEEEMLQDVYGKEVSVKKGLSNFTIQDIALREDGGAVVIAEMNKEYSRRPNVPMRREFNAYTTGAWVDYYFEDLIVFSIHPDGTKHWNKVLHKRQYSQDDNAMYSSYFLFKSPQAIRLLYNDEIRQENTVSEYVITGGGQALRKSVFSTDYHRLRLRFRDAVQVTYNECIIPSQRNNRLNLVRVRYDY